MRASGRDLVELFGYAPDDTTEAAVKFSASGTCPFTNKQCTKTNHDKSEIYGTCSVSQGVKKDFSADVIICPTRLYGLHYSVLKDVVESVWGVGRGDNLVVRGDTATLRKKALALASGEPVVAFGQGSGREIQINSNGQLSMDWILQRYRKKGSDLTPIDFVGVEVQSIDTTGNYRDNHRAYLKLRNGKRPSAIPDSGHGLNWANVHKRLIPQIIRKGNVYQGCSRCSGFFFVVPDTVYQKFEEVLGKVRPATKPSSATMSVITFGLDAQLKAGTIRPLNKMRQVHYLLSDVKQAFSHSTGDGAPAQLEGLLLSLL